jgi:SAM-dependent methyltransferase
VKENQDLERIRRVYSTHYHPDPADYSYIWHARNRIAIYYRQAIERALVELFNHCGLKLENSKILDAGCGTGIWLRFFATLGTPPAALHGLDLLPYRIETARQLTPPLARLQVGSIDHLPYQACSFDLVSQFTVFSSIFNSQIRGAAGKELVRVLKYGGSLVWYDMRSSRTQTTQGLELDELLGLFPGCELVRLQQLHPTFAARLARRSVLLCQLWEQLSILPKTHYLALLRKSA